MIASSEKAEGELQLLCAHLPGFIAATVMGPRTTLAAAKDRLSIAAGIAENELEPVLPDPPLMPSAHAAHIKSKAANAAAARAG